MSLNMRAGRLVVSQKLALEAAKKTKDWKRFQDLEWQLTMIEKRIELLENQLVAPSSPTSSDNADGAENTNDGGDGKVQI